MIALSYYGIFHGCQKLITSTCHKVLVIVFFAVLKSTLFIFYVRLLQTVLSNTNIEMPTLNRNDKVTYENCCILSTRISPARHKKIYSMELLFCSKSPNLSTKSHSEMNYHIAKNTAPQNLSLLSRVNSVIKSFQVITRYVNI